MDCDRAVEDIENRVIQAEADNRLVVFTVQDLEIKLDEILTAGKERVGVGRYQGDEYNDAMKQLRSRWELRSMRLRQANEMLLKRNRGIATSKLEHAPLAAVEEGEGTGGGGKNRREKADQHCGCHIS